MAAEARIKETEFNKIMKNVFKRLIISVSVIVVMAFVIIVGRIVVNKAVEREDIFEIYSIVDEYDVEFLSERGFGNDRFDIYSFSLKKNNRSDDFRLYDQEFEEIYHHHFESIIESMIAGESENRLLNLKRDIENLKQRKDLKYDYVELSGTSKLYLYSRSAGKGYCLILTV